MTKMFMALLATESNTYSPLLTAEQSFREGGLFFGDATRHEPKMMNVILANWRQRGEAAGFEVAEGLSAFAMPNGPVVHRYYLELRDRLLADLKAAMPVDMVLLCLHGAMVSTECLDCEGDIVEQVRALVGTEIPIGVELDLHCSITEKILQHADVIVTYKEYPHIDMVARSDEVFDLTRDQMSGKIRPVMALYDCRMINRWPTTSEPMRGFVNRLSALEGKDDVLSVSLGHGFAFGDVADAGAHILVVTDNNLAKGRQLAEQLGQEFWDLRHQTAMRMLDGPAALDVALASTGVGPAVIADTSDNAGSGGSSDTTGMLSLVLQRQIADVALGYYWDPMAIRFCQEAGEGESIGLRIGGKAGSQSGQPIDLQVTVRRIIDRHHQSMGDIPSELGEAVWVSHGSIDLVLIARRVQVLSPDGFERLGIRLSDKNLVIVKSNQHFHAGFSPIAREIVYAAPEGPTRADFHVHRFLRRKAPYWPVTQNPFADVDIT